MKAFDFSENSFSGTLPEFEGTSPSPIYYFNLMYNNLSGTIPQSLTSLTLVTALLLAFNQLTGTLPDITNMTALSRLVLNSNHLAGTIPQSITSRPLTQLFLQRNQFVSPLPDLSSLTLLTEINLASNLLSGSLPNPHTFPKSTQSLSLGDNQYSGTLPLEYVTHYALKKLQYISLANNNLTGTLPPIPIAIGAVAAAYNLVKNIHGLGLNGNLLNGTIPFSYGEFYTVLAMLDLSDNLLSGTIPSNLGQKSGLATCILSGGTNNYSCPLPPNLPPACGTTVCNCPAGQHFNRSIGDCSVCPDGFYSSFASLTCIVCPRGSVSVAGSSECTPCLPGTYSNVSVCETCPAGQISQNSYAVACDACPGNNYAAANASACIQCPANSQSPPASASIQSCTCSTIPSPGFFQVFGDDGASLTCKHCPPGAACSGDALPLALPDYWTCPPSLCDELSISPKVFFGAWHTTSVLTTE